jgi:hypothetical protein
MFLTLLGSQQREGGRERKREREREREGGERERVCEREREREKDRQKYFQVKIKILGSSEVCCNLEKTKKQYCLIQEDLRFSQ